jgi:hypothetical protein
MKRTKEGGEELPNRALVKSWKLLISRILVDGINWFLLAYGHLAWSPKLV